MSRALIVHNQVFSGAAFLCQLGLCLWGAGLTAWGVLAFAPAAAGSGVPDVIAYLNGLAMASAVSMRTLVCKLLGASAIIAAGVFAGQDGPLQVRARGRRLVCPRRFRTTRAGHSNTCARAAARGA